MNIKVLYYFNNDKKEYLSLNIVLGIKAKCVKNYVTRNDIVIRYIIRS